MSSSLATAGRDLYLDLLKRALLFELWDNDGSMVAEPNGFFQKAIFGALFKRGMRVVRYRENAREQGSDWPLMAHTMIGRKRLENLHACVQSVIDDRVPGDLIETGVWRGGSCIFMRGVLKANDVADRTVWVADSFAGLPKADPNLPEDPGTRFEEFKALAISLEQVQEHFRKYGLLDNQVRFLKGWFKDTLPIAPIQRLAVARLDGDMYESTMDSLRSLYHKLSVGGYCIVDDYSSIEACKRATDEFRKTQGITDPILEIDWSGVYWRKS